MVGLGRVAGRRTDPAIRLADQLLGRERLVGRVAPQLAPDACVHVLGRRLGEAVGERLDQDRRVVVVGRLEALGDGDLLVAGGDDEGADVVDHPGDRRGATKSAIDVLGLPSRRRSC